VQSLVDDTKHDEDGYANNEYVKLEDPHPDEFEDDGWENLTYVDNITAKFNRSIAHNATENLKMRDIFKAKVKLLQVNTKWSIKRVIHAYEDQQILLHSSLCFHFKSRTIIVEMCDREDCMPLCPIVQVNTSKFNLM